MGAGGDLTGPGSWALNQITQILTAPTPGTALSVSRHLTGDVSHGRARGGRGARAAENERQTGAQSAAHRCTLASAPVSLPFPGTPGAQPPRGKCLPPGTDSRVWPDLLGLAPLLLLSTIEAPSPYPPGHVTYQRSPGAAQGKRAWRAFLEEMTEELGIAGCIRV